MTNGAMPGPDDDADDWPWPLKIRGNVYDFPEWHTLSETISRGMFLVDKALSAAKARTIARRMKDGRVATAMLRMAQNEIGFFPGAVVIQARPRRPAISTRPLPSVRMMPTLARNPSGSI